MGLHLTKRVLYTADALRDWSEPRDGGGLGKRGALCSGRQVANDMLHCR
jgi:hypothetical protein